MPTPAFSIRERAWSHFDEMVDERRILHSVPELAFQEFETTAFIDARCRELGLERVPLLTETGALWRLDGTSNGTNNEKRVLLRADIDGLALVEAGNTPFASIHEGRMHACGHDAHVAQLLGVARILSAMRDELAGTVYFLFQPAEEVLGGARSILDGGALRSLDLSFVLGLHLLSPMPVGLVGARPGVAMAAGRLLRIEIRGPGGHVAAQPIRTNTLEVAVEIVGRFPEVIHGMEHEGTPCACAAGSIHGGNSANGAPSETIIEATVRTFTPKQHAEALVRLQRIVDEATDGTACTARLAVTAESKAVVNDESVTEIVREQTLQIFERNRLVELGPMPGSDDMGEFLAEIPGTYFVVGAGRADGSVRFHHSEAFSIDERSMRVAAAILAGSALGLLDSTRAERR